ncbi:MAG: endonuclease/exonuclease/phosphatase family protein [Fibrobacterales bacterium]
MTPIIHFGLLLLCLSLTFCEATTPKIETVLDLSSEAGSSEEPVLSSDDAPLSESAPPESSSPESSSAPTSLSSAASSSTPSSSVSKSSSAASSSDLKSLEDSSSNSSSATSSSASQDSLKIMTYNLWFTETWITSRRSIAFKMIQSENPDIIGIQENWQDQGIGYFPTKDILDTLSEYRSAAFEDRNDILYKKDLFTVIDSGRFELESAEGRHCVWALFKDTLDRQFYIYNTHWNYQDFAKDSWLSHGVSLAAKIRDREFPDYPAIVTGDFNTNDENGAQYFRGEYADKTNDYPFRDTWLDINEVGVDYMRTKTIDNHGRTGEKLDYIYVPEEEWITLDAQVIEYRDPNGCGDDTDKIFSDENGCAPSDHEPVTATLRFK